LLGPGLLYRLPIFTNNRNGILPVIEANPVNARVEVYITDNGGGNAGPVAIMKAGVV